MAGFLQNKSSKYSRKGTPDKYYPEAGPARREGKLPLRGQTGFGNPATGVIPGDFIPSDPGSPPSPVVNYLITQNNDQMITEDGNNIILE